LKNISSGIFEFLGHKK